MNNFTALAKQRVQYTGRRFFVTMVSIIETIASLSRFLVSKSNFKVKSNN